MKRACRQNAINVTHENKTFQDCIPKVQSNVVSFLQHYLSLNPKQCLFAPGKHCDFMKIKKSLFALLLGGLGIGVTEFVMMGLLPYIAKDLNVTIPEAGHLISAYALGVVIGAPLLILTAGNFPPKKLLLILMGLFTGFNALSIVAAGFDMLFVSRLLSGLPHGAFFGVGAVVASRLAEKGKEAQAVSVMFAGLTIANLIGVPFGTYLGHHFGWRYAFILIVLIGIITLVALYAWMPKMENKQDGSIVKQLSFFKKLDAWLIIITTSIGTGGLFCWISYISPMLTEISHFSSTDIPYIMSFAGLGMLVGNIFGGWLTDRYDPARASVYLLLAMSVSLVLVSFLSYNQVTALVMTFITGGLAFSLGAPIQMLMIRTAKGAELLAASVSQACFNIGNALGAFLGGLPLVMGYSYTSPVWVGAVMALAGAGTAFILVSRMAPSSPESTGYQAEAS
jgi:DHA1 family arabinose polymer transporter-like MFS transporter